jgi:tetratricopeptide (TPR) repeat protein
LQSALRLKPTFTDAYNNMASALVQKGLIPAALQCYKTALACDPNLVRPLHCVFALRRYPTPKYLYMGLHVRQVLQ